MMFQPYHSPSPHGPHPLFTSGLELADLVVTSDLLHRSWAAISNLYGDGSYCDSRRTEPTAASPFCVRYKAYQQPNYTIIAFVSSSSLTNHHEQAGRLVLSPTLQQNHPLFEFLCTKHNLSFSLNKEAITIFISLFDELSLLHHQFGNSTPLIITGHSLGGSIAALFTLWMLENIPSSTINRRLCITFGSPLIGDNGLQRAILNCSWNSNFLHVVSNHDIIPRLFISPQSHLTASSASQAIGYKPFGTFLMCSQSGYACFDDPETVMQLMATMGSESEGWQIVNDVDYGEILEYLKGRVFCRGVSEFRESTHALQAGIFLQLEAIGVYKTQNRQQNIDYNTLMAVMEKRERANYLKHKGSVTDPSKKLHAIKINMAQLEWYTKVSKALGVGYYDSYKRKQFQRDMDVVKYKNNLTNYWKDMVREAERKPHKQGVSFRTTRWLYGGTNYRRLVEPLDIADYYKIQGQKEYKTQGRSHHYILLERWQEDERAARNQNAKTRNMASTSLTEDSCFWAHVEEAIILSKLLKIGEEVSPAEKESSRENLRKFETYVMDLIKNYAVSTEIFLEQSSFMQWWRDYEIVIEPSYSSGLTDFMKNHRYRQYA
ncbi:hypothetical protein HHK36_015190 [Tetracentron sinense]|uniref:Senescence-associated carboxylesterase 101-like n=1 Tax=Tetracentron sinense TaxID=13715 RepID=A0A834Z4I9_TETSI|nr:hypothetical protein HHK36_015190 [Tetracentron sinense]